MSERQPLVPTVKVAQDLKHSLATIQRVLFHCSTDSEFCVPPPPGSWLHSFSWKLFTFQATFSLPLTHTYTDTDTSFSCLTPIFDTSPALTCKQSLCHLAASGVHSLSHSLSFCFPLSFPPPATSAVAWRAGEKRAEETGDFARSKYSLYVCGVLSSKERRGRVQFL